MLNGSVFNLPFDARFSLVFTTSIAQKMLLARTISENCLVYEMKIVNNLTAGSALGTDWEGRDRATNERVSASRGIGGWLGSQAGRSMAVNSVGTDKSGFGEMLFE